MRRQTTYGLNMEKSFFGKMFSRSQKPVVQLVPAYADFENAEAQFVMGLKFASSAGASQDYLQAAEWYRKAAAQNHSLAQFNLGMMYACGQGVARDDAESTLWFGRAARLGDAGAQFNLGRNCHRASFDGLPEAMPESKIEAYKWYRLAAEQGYQDSDTASAALVANMTRADITTGNRRVVAFKLEQPQLFPK
jgi:TPR repeat protein